MYILYQVIVQRHGVQDIFRKDSPGRMQFTAALIFKGKKDYKQPKYPSVGDQLKNYGMLPLKRVHLYEYK